jgi:hypothetical protein
MALRSGFDETLNKTILDFAVIASLYHPKRGVFAEIA